MSELDLSSTASDETKASYGIGIQMGQQLASSFDGISLAAAIAGLEDGFHERDLQIPANELNAAFEVIQAQMQQKQASQAADQASVGEAFLAENAKRDEVTVTASGLQYEVIESGDGEMPTASSKVRTHYRGTLIDGTEFDSSYRRGEPAEFPVGGVIAGWTEALKLMAVGSKWKLYIPYQLAYGERGAGGSIGPYQALIFEIELLDIVG